MNSLQFNHGMISLRGMDRGAALDPAGRGRASRKKRKWAMVEGADGAHMNRSLPLDKCLDDCLVVYAQNGEALRPEQGYPLRLVVPGWEGNVSIKWLRRIKLGDKPWHSARRDFEIHRPDAGRHCARLHLADRRQIRHHLPLPRKAARSVPAIYEIRGWRGPATARSSASTSPRMAASIGRAARLHEPVLSKALTKFTLPWRWDGQPALLESRVDRRDRLCAADDCAAAKAARIEFGLSQQFDPDLAGQA